MAAAGLKGRSHTKQRKTVERRPQPTNNGEAAAAEQRSDAVHRSLSLFPRFPYLQGAERRERPESGGKGIGFTLTLLQ